MCPTDGPEGKNEGGLTSYDACMVSVVGLKPAEELARSLLFTANFATNLA